MKRFIRQWVTFLGTGIIGLLILPVSLLLLAIRAIWNTMDMILEEKGEQE